ncbi:unnamed protein product, partial [Prorocentrum cordatum]
APTHDPTQIAATTTGSDAPTVVPTTAAGLQLRRQPAHACIHMGTVWRQATTTAATTKATADDLAPTGAIRGDSKDSESRQVRCCQNYARPNKLVAKACDIFHECISGTEDLQTRPTFNRMIDHCYKNNGGYFDHSVRGQYPPGAGRHCPGDGGPVVD